MSNVGNLEICKFLAISQTLKYKNFNNAVLCLYVFALTVAEPLFDTTRSSEILQLMLWISVMSS